jgi:hypothetical protein
MIEGHKYPKEFFFAVTNKGIGGLLRKWGEGASMIRGEWKPRDNEDTKPKNVKEIGEKKTGGDRMVVEEDDDDEESSNEEEAEGVDMEELERTPKPGVRPLHPASPPKSGTAKADASGDVDALAEGMSSLTLIPSSVRFGRGARAGGLGTRGGGRGGRGGIVPPQAVQNSGGHQRRASTSSVTETRQLASGGAGNAGRKGQEGKRGKGHRTSASIGTGAEMDISGGDGGDIVLIPPAAASGPGRGRGGRGKRGGRGRAH